MFKNECPWSVRCLLFLSLISWIESIRAYQALRLLLVPPPSSKDNIQVNGKALNKPGTSDGKLIPAIDFFGQLEIYPGKHFLKNRYDFLISIGSKLTHFKRIHKQTGIPYSQMVGLPLCSKVHNTQLTTKKMGSSCSLTTNIETKKLNL